MGIFQCLTLIQYAWSIILVLGVVLFVIGLIYLKKGMDDLLP
jgi:hypothetical protein